MNIFLDSNIWLRLIFADVQDEYIQCDSLFKHIDEGTLTPYTSAIVLLETQFIMLRIAKMPKRSVINTIDAFLQTRTLTIIEKTDFRTAFSLHKKTGVKLADCLIATQIPKHVTLCTYDKEFIKIPYLTPLTPKQVLAKLQRQFHKRSQPPLKVL